MLHESSDNTPFLVPHCEASIDILFVDEHLLVINKPSGLLSVPGRDPRNHDSVINRLLPEYPDARIVHRLDMDTSGVMVLAIGAAAHSNLGRQFQERKIEKRYEALVLGNVEADAGEINEPLTSDWPNRPHQKICHETGKPSRTHYQVIERLNAYTHLSLHPITGRTHQLRVHCASIGHPILGDRFYASPEAQAMATQLMLHAIEICLHHPATGELCKYMSPPSFPWIR